MTYTLSRLASPLAPLLAVTADDGTLHALDFADFEVRLRSLFARHHPGAALADGPAPAALARALDAYFSGDLTALDGLHVAGIGSEFQRRVWAALRRIPAGETRGYGQLAAMIGNPAAARAVGLANGANPIGIVVPCHRVIGAGGQLTGYAGGVVRKAWLLRHEGAAVPVSTS